MPAKKADSDTRKAPKRAKATPGTLKKGSGGKRSTKRTTAKTAPPKKTAPNKVAKPKKKAGTTASHKVAKQAGTSVTLPRTMPKRSREKVQVLQAWFSGRIDDWFIRTARYGGLFFVVAGAFCTLWSMSATSGLAVTGQTATTLDSTSTTTENTTDPEPSAAFDVTISTSDASKVSVHIFVPYAQEVTVLALHKESNTVFTLGLANMVKTDQWQLRWDTLQYPNGTYRLMAEITNEFGVYTEQDSTTYDIYNESNDTTTTTPSIDNVTFSLLNDEELVGDTDIVVEAPGYESVDLYAREKATGKAHPIDLVNADPANGFFQFLWTTDSYADGEYVIEAKLHYDGTTDALEGPRVFVQNTTTTTADSANHNNVTFSIADQTVISGDVSVTVEAPGYDQVRLMAYEMSTETITKLENTSADISAGTWKFLWRTANVPDGEYKLGAEVTYNGFDDGVEGPMVRIENTTMSATSDDTATSEADTTTETVETSTKDVTTVEEAADEKVIAEPPRLRVPPDPLSGTVELRIDGRAEFVELYARSVMSTAHIFLGLARKIETERWVYRFNTTNIPNGTYDLVARARTVAGLLNSEPVRRKIENTLTTGDRDTQEGTSDTDATTRELQKVVQETEADVVFDDSAPQRVGENIAEYVGELLSEYSVEIASLEARYISAVRSQDDLFITRIKDEFAALRKSMLDAVFTDPLMREHVNSIDRRLAELFARKRTRIEATETIIRERTNDAISLDSDGDGVTDFDERTIYGTDPDLPDTDGDGFTDGVEILSGYDPLDPEAEAVVDYESPKESGVTRDDVLTIEAIDPISEGTSADGVPAQAVIRGKALPNSFVTLYIYSTPVIVTVKTEADGSFAYRFDKELEDGQHEVYVGITDNAGKIVAKSRPFAFVKEAQAFTPVDAAATSRISSEPQYQSYSPTNNFVIVLSIAIVAIGLVLILIGWNLESTRPKKPTTEQPAAT